MECGGRDAVRAGEAHRLRLRDFGAGRSAAKPGEFAIYDCPRNTHEGGILRRSVVPADLTAADLARARDIASTIAAALDYVGVLAVEMFYLGPDAAPAERLLVNEIAPRVHNSGHWTIDACAVSQFENHMRAVAGWPLGSTERHSDAEMLNLIGQEALDWRKLAAEPGACLHLYGKREARSRAQDGPRDAVVSAHHSRSRDYFIGTLSCSRPLQTLAAPISPSSTPPAA